MAVHSNPKPDSIGSLNWAEKEQFNTQLDAPNGTVAGAHQYIIGESSPVKNQEALCIRLSVQTYLHKFYKTNTDMLIHYDKCLHGSELELAKTAVLLLCAAVQQSLCPSTQPLITSLTQLDEGVQKEIRECLEAVLLPSNDINGHLTADFVSVLCKQSLQNETTPRKHSCVNSLSNLRSLTKIKTPSHYSSQGSPLRALLDSPLLVQRTEILLGYVEYCCLRHMVAFMSMDYLLLKDTSIWLP
ncbi:uncharacterized protein LOC111086877 [Limulus polyphemus]|uniref:Uncharacterized protein LOC111086877 n=1 Tax=Limulus polyphemus TaxID=6850 RepID=A0ABM1SU97_LIMPO|nr:uncharacterized protein LOC111086877 [Limulus polyphemus]